MKIRKQRVQKECLEKKKVKFEDYKSCLKAIELEHKINHLEKNKSDVGSFKDDHKEFINNKCISKSPQRFISKRYLFPEEVNEINLSSNDDKITQSIDSVETFAYGMSKDLICRKEKTNVTTNN